MKVYCVNNEKAFNNDMNLTVGKWYEVIVDGDICCSIFNDKGEKYIYRKSRFLSPEESKKQLIKERFEK